jgi:KDO2-lipid IV(A) lauroyltransferase
VNPILGLLLRIPLHGMGLFVAALPRSWEMALGSFLGRLAMRVDPKRRKIAEDNIARCLPELSLNQQRDLLGDNYAHYGRLILELAHMFTPIAGHFRAYAQRTTYFDGYENWAKANAKGKGVLFCSAHFANWETTIAAAAIAGMPMTIVTRRLKPAWLDAWMEKTRLSTGVSAAYQPRTIPTVMKTLRDGGGVVFVVDQYMPPPMGEPLRFFGFKVDTLSAVAPLARRTGAAIIPIHPIREPDGRIRVIIEPEFVLGDEDKADNQRLVDKVEGFIRQVPAQWIWGHRRFKNVDWSDRMERTGQKVP